ncbi:XRE family transcriptional regulator [Sphingopyxis sp. LC81]|uniref:helix-turn-helix domain-containing protein n=1 Tax=unclassified Sphingopyxis TaxID=2614943 RepID=UPI00050F617A|nr:MULTISPECIES: transcriptional regulator [unclassified Sphingopyxis]KGB53351.1 XRE family transcriptional regulator [Sphingopyxis sp. LC81]MDT7531258.1 XRE family transcriptional regulator [Sphingopyxis sp. SE2]
MNADEPPTPPCFAPAAIKKLREKNKVSLTVFARCLNASASTVWRWEAGTAKPSSFARKLLAVVQKHGLQVLA